MVFKVPRLRLSLHPQIPPRMQLQRYKKNGRFARVLPKKLQFILGFNTLFWTKKTGARQTKKIRRWRTPSTSSADSQYVPYVRAYWLSSNFRLQNRLRRHVTLYVTLCVTLFWKGSHASAPINTGVFGKMWGCEGYQLQSQFCTDSQSPNRNHRLRHPKSKTKASQTYDLATEKRRVTTTNSSSCYPKLIELLC